MTDYVVEPDGTITFNPDPEDYERIRDEERDLLWDGGDSS